MSDPEICKAEDYIFGPHGGQFKVKLPSGVVFMLRYPSLASKFKGTLISQSVAAQMDADTGSELIDEQRALEIARRYYAILCEVCVQPRVSMTPQAGELHPDRIRLDDAVFIARWAGGEIDNDGVDLATFRTRKAGATSVDGAGSADVRPVAE